jgi:myosin heavy subunit
MVIREVLTSRGTYLQPGVGAMIAPVSKPKVQKGLPAWADLFQRESARLVSNQKALSTASLSRIKQTQKEIDAQKRELVKLSNAGLVNKRSFNSAIKKLDHVRTNFASLISDSKKFSQGAKKKSVSGASKKAVAKKNQRKTQEKSGTAKRKAVQSRKSNNQGAKRQGQGGKKSAPKKTAAKKKTGKQTATKKRKVSTPSKSARKTIPVKAKSKVRRKKTTKAVPAKVAAPAKVPTQKRHKAYKVPPEFVGGTRRTFPIVPLTNKESKQIFNAFLLEDEAMVNRLQQIDEQLLKPGQVWGYKVGKNFVSLRTFRSLARFSDYMNQYITTGKLTENSFDVFNLLKYGAGQSPKLTDAQLGEHRENAAQKIRKQAERNVQKSRTKAAKKQAKYRELKKKARKVEALEKKVSKLEKKGKEKSTQLKQTKQELKSTKKQLKLKIKRKKRG